MDPLQCSPESPTPLVGNFELVLRCPTSYEPPMYLYPELLPKVPEGTLPVSVSDAVANAVNVVESHINIATLANVPAMELQEEAECSQIGNESRAASGVDTATVAPMATLASLIASGRLQEIGLPPELLQRGAFSSESIIRELVRVAKKLRLSESEAKPISTNHFINLLAYTKLIEMNNQVLTDVKKEPTRSSRRENGEELDIGALQPSDDPWSSDIERQPGIFVAASEQNVERRVEIIENLSALYRRPWKTLQSRGIQTERFTPGVINETAPYADPGKLPRALMDPEKDLGWRFPAAEHDVHSSWKFHVTSSTTGASEVIPLCGRVMNFGRDAGVTSAAAGTVTNVHFGLSAFTNHPEFISPHHFSLHVLSGKTTTSNGVSEINLVEKQEVVGGEENNYSLWLMNYGLNGVRIVGKRWELGGMVQLEVGDTLHITDDMSIVIQDSMQVGGIEMSKEEEEEEHYTKTDVLNEE